MVFGWSVAGAGDGVLHRVWMFGSCFDIVFSCFGSAGAALVLRAVMVVFRWRLVLVGVLVSWWRRCVV